MNLINHHEAILYSSIRQMVDIHILPFELGIRRAGILHQVLHFIIDSIIRMEIIIPQCNSSSYSKCYIKRAAKSVCFEKSGGPGCCDKVLATISNSGNSVIRFPRSAK